MQSSFDSSTLEIAVLDDIAGESWDNYAAAHIDYVSKAVSQNPAERVKQCSGECYMGPISDIKSYDPFGPIKIYHRDIPPVNEEDKQWIKGWTSFFNMSYADLNDAIPNIILANQHQPLISKAISYPTDTLFQSF